MRNKQSLLDFQEEQELVAFYRDGGFRGAGKAVLRSVSQKLVEILRARPLQRICGRAILGGQIILWPRCALT